MDINGNWWKSYNRYQWKLMDITWLNRPTINGRQFNNNQYSNNSNVILTDINGYERDINGILIGYIDELASGVIK
jgi:hypothetical protein